MPAAVASGGSGRRGGRGRSRGRGSGRGGGGPTCGRVPRGLAGGPEPKQGGEEPDASQVRGDREASASPGEEASRPVGEEASRPVSEEASRPVCRPQTSPRGDGNGQARRETSPYRVSRVAPIAWVTDGVEPRGVHVCCQSDGNGPPGQVQPTRRSPSAVGGSGGPEEPVFGVPVGPESTHR